MLALLINSRRLRLQVEPVQLLAQFRRAIQPIARHSYQVHGRIVIGQDNNGDFTFAPMEQTCNLGVLTPSKDVPSGVPALQR